MRKITKAQKIAEYESLKKDSEKYMLAVYDLVNNNFSKPVTNKDLDYFSGGQGDKLSVRVSMRGMPLFLAEWSNKSEQRTSTQVFTESELEDIVRDGSFAVANRMLRDAYYRLREFHYVSAQKSIEVQL